MIRVAVIQSKVNSGGVKNLVLEYLRHTDKSQVVFDLICDRDSNSIPTEEFEKAGGRVYAVTPYINILRHTYEVWKILRRNKYDVVHGFDNLMNVFALSGAYFAGTRVRIAESLTMAHRGELQYWIKLALKPFASWFANYYMACGEDCGRWQFGNRAYRAGRVNVFKTVINAAANAYAPALRAETRRQYGWQDKVVYGFIGRFTMQKNPMFLIDVFRNIALRQPEALLVLIGWGKMERQMLDTIDALGLKERVAFLGRREDIRQFYNAFDAFLLPSLYEGLPIVGLESQSAGLPVLFSTEVTREAAACQLARFIPLEKGADYWAEQAIEAAKRNMPVRRSHADDIIAGGYDSKSEARRLVQFYTDALSEQSRL